MGKRGPPPIPQSLKLLRGNPGHQKLNMDEPKPAPIVPVCPEWLPLRAKEYWAQLAPKLETIGLLTEVDLLDFQNLCIAAAQLKDAALSLQKKRSLVMRVKTKSGGFYEQQRPEVGIVNACTATIIKLSARFGLSPADRVGLVVKGNDKEDEFEAFLEKKSGKKQKAKS